jgi:hypothetical protein
MFISLINRDVHSHKNEIRRKKDVNTSHKLFTYLFAFICLCYKIILQKNEALFVTVSQTTKDLTDKNIDIFVTPLPV